MTMQLRIIVVVALLVMLVVSGSVWAREVRPAVATEPVIWRAEAETGVLVQPMVIGYENGASACGYVASQATSGAVHFQFSVPTSGNYYLWARAMGTGWNSNSFFVSFDDSAPFHFEIPWFDGTWSWGWEIVRPVDLDPLPTALGFGKHTLHVTAREPGARLDTLVLTSDASYRPSDFTPCGQSPTSTPMPHVRPTPTPVGGGPSGWVIEAVHAPLAVMGLGDRYLAVDSDGHPHAMFGGVHLYHAWQHDSIWYVETVDETDGVGGCASIALDADDHLHVSYYDSIHGNLRYAFRDDVGWHIQVVASIGDVGTGTSIAVGDDGTIHITFGNDDTETLCYARSTDTGWSVTVLPGTRWYVSASLAVDSEGQPHIACLVEDALQYRWHSRSGWQSEVITRTDCVDDSGSWLGRHCVLALDASDTPFVAFDVRGCGPCSTDAWVECMAKRSSGWVSVFGHRTSDVIQRDRLGNAPIRDDREPSTCGSVHSGRAGLALDPNGFPHLIHHSVVEAYEIYAEKIWYVYQDPIGWHGGYFGDTEYESDPVATVAMSSGGMVYVAWMDDSLVVAQPGNAQWNMHTSISLGWAGEGTCLRLDESDHAHISFFCEPVGGMGTLVKYAWQPAEWCVDTVAPSQTDAQLGRPGLPNETTLAVDRHGIPTVGFLNHIGWSVCYIALAQPTLRGWTPVWKLGSPQSWSAWVDFDAENAARVAYDWNGCECEGCVDYYDDRSQEAIRISVCTFESRKSVKMLALDDSDWPHIVYISCPVNNAWLSWSNSRITYVWQDPGGWHTEDLELLGPVGGDSASALGGDGQLRIAYFDASSGWLKLATRRPTGWETESIVRGQFSLFSTSLALDAQDNGHIAFYDSEARCLKYASRDSSGWRIYGVDEVGDVGRYCSLALDSFDQPHIAYQDTSQGHVKYAHWLPASAVLWLPLLTR